MGWERVVSGRLYFYAMGQRAASLGRPRWLVHHECPTALAPLWAVLAWLDGFDKQSQWRRA